MSYLRYLADRIMQNKINKGFPIGDFEYDLGKIKEEVQELEDALKEGQSSFILRELADIIIMAVGLAEQVEPACNLTEIISGKMTTNERRKITKISDHEFSKEEG